MNKRVLSGVPRAFRDWFRDTIAGSPSRAGGRRDSGAGAAVSVTEYPVVRALTGDRPRRDGVVG